MAAEATRMIKIFYSYSSADAPLQNELERHLEVLKRSGQITTWHDREIQPGVEWKREIDTYLNAADIILLLISPDFLASDYCYSVEMRRALERHKAGEAYVIPIILRPVDWEETPIALLQALPTNGQPITIWRNRDKAFLDVVKGIDKLVKILLSRPKPPKTEERHVEVSSSEGKLKTKEFSGAINIFCRYAREDAP